MIRIKNLRIDYNHYSDIKKYVADKLRLSPQAVLGVFVVRKALDARRYHGQGIAYVYEVDIKLAENIEKEIAYKYRNDKNIVLVPEQQQNILMDSIKNYKIPNVNIPPVVIGFGPSGIFAALTLAQAGLNPIILERGQDIDTRTQDVEKFWLTGILLPNSNVQFGEGGAGTFSDGKLTARQNDPLMQVIIDELIKAGAPAEIGYLQKPHIGTDCLRNVVKNIRNKIIRLGGTIKFGATVTDIKIDDTTGEIKSVIINDNEEIAASTVFLGIGHSARDTYEMLMNNRVSMESKPFAMGVRIEHSQDFIDRMQYGIDAGADNLPVADYALTYKDIKSGRGVYSFCMCPGGYVVAASSEPFRVVTNGMSNHARDSGIANSALLVQVSPNDYGCKQDILGGIRLQRKLEENAYKLAGGDYYAPVQSVGDFLTGNYGSRDFAIDPTYRPGVRAVNIRSILPNYIGDSLDRALRYFNERFKGFGADDIPLTGIETRSSAPCRILRDKVFLMSENVNGLYPIGEGAGYAGGIMSAALDGMKSAIAFLKRLHNNNR